MTASSPTFTLRVQKICTVAGERPAVVQSPNDGFAEFLQKLEENFYVQIISVYVVQVDDVGIDLSDHLNEPCRCPLGAKAVQIEEPCQ